MYVRGAAAAAVAAVAAVREPRRAAAAPRRRRARPRATPRAPRRHRTLAVAAPRRCSCPTPMRRRRIRTPRRCGRPAGSAGRPWRPSYRCARSACPTCRARSCRPSAPRARYDVLAVGARRPDGVALRAEHQVAVVLQGQRVRPVLRRQRLSTFKLLAAWRVCHPRCTSLSRGDIRFVDRRGRLVAQIRRG